MERLEVNAPERSPSPELSRQSQQENAGAYPTRTGERADAHAAIQTEYSRAVDGDNASNVDDLDDPEEAPALADRLQEHFGNSDVTPSGRAFYEPHDTDMREAAKHVPAEPGSYTVDMHGDPAATYIGDDTVSADDLAALLEHDPNYGGQPVRLFACETGKGDDPFAQHLADRLGTDVTAPTDLVWSSKDGETFVAPAAGVDVYGMPIPGEHIDDGWRTFSPDSDTQ